MKLTTILTVALAGLIGGPAAANDGPLKVYVLSGQSNMQGHARTTTFDVIGLDPKTAPMLKDMRNPDGSPKVCDQVWISSIGSSEEEQVGKLTVGYGANKNGPKIGPEFTFGIYMQELVDEPILIIKTAWGGKSINTDFRPPSAGPYVFNESQLKKFKDQGKDIAKIKADRAAATGTYYRLMIDHVKMVLGDIKRVYPDYDPAQGYELAGFVWFQGWNDMVDSGTYPDRSKPGGYDQYSEVLAHFIRDVRKDLAAPKMPFVIGVMGTGGPVDQYTPDKKRYASTHDGFRKAMAAPASRPEFRDNVVAVLTETCWDMEMEKIRARDKTLQQEVEALIKDGRLKAKDKKATLDKMRVETFTPRERDILENGASNAGFHYLGSAKILGEIGKAFAEALAELSD